MVTSFDRGGRLGRALKGVVDKLDYMLMIMDEIREACEVRRAEFGDRRERPPPPLRLIFCHPIYTTQKRFSMKYFASRERKIVKERQRKREKERQRKREKGNLYLGLKKCTTQKRFPVNVWSGERETEM